MLQMLDSGETIFSIFDADTPPNVWLTCGELERGIEQPAQAFGALGKDLIGVPVGGDHDFSGSSDVFLRHVFMEEVAHGIDKNHLGSAPAKRLSELLRHQSQIESLFVGMAFNPAEAFRESLRVAMLAAVADLGAAAHGVPGCVGPLNSGT